MTTEASEISGRLEAAGAWAMRISEGQLVPQEQTRFAHWLGADPENAAAFEDAVGVWGGLADIALDAEVIALRRNALAAIDARRGPRRQVPVPMRRMAAAAALAVLMVCAGGAWMIERPQTLSTEVGERRTVVLADGSQLSLDAATTVKVRLDRRRRNLTLLRGRAKFDVAKDAARPFTVAAADKLVRATGTQFSVELLERRVRIVLYEGSVQVMANENAPDASGLRVRRGAGVGAGRRDNALAPGEELVSAVASDLGEVTAADVPRSLAWEAGTLVFVDEPLQAAVERINRYASAPLKVSPAGLEGVRVDGVFSAGDTGAFVEGVTGLLPVEAVAVSDGTLLRRRPGSK